MDTLCGNSLIISTKPRSHVACVCSWTKAVLALTNDSNNADSIYYHRAQQISEPWGLVLSRTHWSSHSYRVAILLQQLSILHAKNTRYRSFTRRIRDTKHLFTLELCFQVILYPFINPSYATLQMTASQASRTNTPLPGTSLDTITRQHDNNGNTTPVVRTRMCIPTGTESNTFHFSAARHFDR